MMDPVQASVLGALRGLQGTDSRSSGAFPVRSRVPAYRWGNGAQSREGGCLRSRGWRVECCQV